MRPVPLHCTHGAAGGNGGSGSTFAGAGGSTARAAYATATQPAHRARSALIAAGSCAAQVRT
jgi:hypothetical protein